MTTKMKTAKATNYTWASVHGLIELLNWLSTRKQVEEVEITNTARNFSTLFSSYGTSLSYVKSAMLFDDGCILLAAMTSTWQGTFASHESIEVRYYTLTPKV